MNSENDHRRFQIMLEKPVISDRFDMDDIRKIRAYNSQRYLKMTKKEILADIHEGAERYRQRVACLKTQQEIK